MELLYECPPPVTRKKDENGNEWQMSAQGDKRSDQSDNDRRSGTVKEERKKWKWRKKGRNGRRNGRNGRNGGVLASSRKWSSRNRVNRGGESGIVSHYRVGNKYGAAFKTV
uniref:Uncharacterized protein n=1 Tax=Caenorhabditis japonica TaxID=281687 RepID=A0A8R1I6Z9_CAEJA